MLEILVSLRRRNIDNVIGGKDTFDKKCGDIICVKKQPCNWGTEEKRLFLITCLDDPTLEASLNKNECVFPYAVYDSEDKLINRSKYRVDVNMFTGSSGLDPNDTTSEPVPPESGSINPNHLVLGDLIFDDSDRTT